MDLDNGSVSRPTMGNSNKKPDEMLHRAWWHGFAAVRSEEGFEVRLRGLRGGLEYSEGDHVVRLGVEPAAADVDWIVHIRPCRWQSPYQDEPITDEKCKQIKARVVSALSFLKIKYVLAEQN